MLQGVYASVSLEGFFHYICTSKGMENLYLFFPGSFTEPVFFIPPSIPPMLLPSVFPHMHPQRLSRSVFFFSFLFFYTSKASVGWISRCSIINLSCLQLSELKNLLKKLSLSLPFCISHLFICFIPLRQFSF